MNSLSTDGYLNHNAHETIRFLSRIAFFLFLHTESNVCVVSLRWKAKANHIHLSKYTLVHSHTTRFCQTAEIFIVYTAKSCNNKHKNMWFLAFVCVPQWLLARSHCDQCYFKWKNTNKKKNEKRTGKRTKFKKKKLMNGCYCALGIMRRWLYGNFISRQLAHIKITANCYALLKTTLLPFSSCWLWESPINDIEKKANWKDLASHRRIHILWSWHIEFITRFILLFYL